MGINSLKTRQEDPSTGQGNPVPELRPLGEPIGPGFDGAFAPSLAGHVGLLGIRGVPERLCSVEDAKIDRYLGDHDA